MRTPHTFIPPKRPPPLVRPPPPPPPHQVVWILGTTVVGALW
jgi:hypothetical protein